ncbi:unnamed protein product [Ectocarpus sp. 12 AP-2014]
MAEVHARTVRLPRGSGTSQLTGRVLLEGSALWTLLKHRQCRGPFWHAPPVGQPIRADRPHEVAIYDERGSLSGVNSWGGLLTELDKLLVDVQREGLYTRHECRLCCQRIEVSGEEVHVRGAVCDGLTACRRPKCAVYGCADGLCGTRGSRYCQFHEEARGHMCNITDPPCPRLREEESLVCSFHRPWETYYLNWIRRGGWHATSAARAAGQAREPRLIRYLRSMLGPRHTFGYLICTWSCGIIAGMSPLIEAEGDSETAAALDDIWQDPAHRPNILFYDRGCKRRKHLRCHPDPTWAMTINIVDRFHALHHHERECQEFCSPNRKDDPLLWINNGVDEPTFRWNSSRAESTNSILHGLGPCVSKMSSTMNRLVMMTNMFCLNELLLREKLHGEEPRFRL